MGYVHPRTHLIPLVAEGALSALEMQRRWFSCTFSTGSIFPQLPVCRVKLDKLDSFEATILYYHSSYSCGAKAYKDPTSRYPLHNVHVASLPGNLLSMLLCWSHKSEIRRSGLFKLQAVGDVSHLPGAVGWNPIITFQGSWMHALLSPLKVVESRGMHSQDVENAC